MINDEKSLKALESKLHSQLQYARTQAEAINFVIQAKDDLSQVRDEIRQRREKISLLEIESLYLRQLQESLEIVQSEIQRRGGYAEQIVGILSRRVVPFDAMVNAYQFILESNFDTNLITKEIETTEEIIINPPRTLLSARYPESTPNLYKQAYLKTLKSIVQAMKGMKS